jgi:hypothetical protein
MDYYATTTGTNPRQLRFRLDWLTRQYFRSLTSRPGCPARLDVSSDQARELAGVLEDAWRLLLQERTSRSAAAVAVRHAEELWHRLFADLARVRRRRPAASADKPELAWRYQPRPVAAQTIQRHPAPFGAAAAVAAQAQERAHRHRARG